MNPHGSPLRIIVRGDCCSRRTIRFNPEFFGERPVVISDEKSRSDFHVSHLCCGSPSREQMRQFMAVEEMNPTERHYASCQTTRETIQVGDADLLVMDDYADLNFEAWRNRAEGWLMWVHPKYVRDRAAFERDFESRGHMTVDESLGYHVQLISRYRQLNPGIPILYMHQPVARYPKLEDRDNFRQLGHLLEARIDGLYYSEIDNGLLEPDEEAPHVGLHFSAATYRRMLDVAVEKGLARHLDRHRDTVAAALPAKASQQGPQTASATSVVMPTSLDDIRDETNAERFPVYTLVKANSAACFYGAGRFGQYAEIHVADAGIEDVTLVDPREKNLSRMSDIYPSQWVVRVADPVVYVRNLAADRLFDVVIFDASSTIQASIFGNLPDWLAVSRHWLVIAVSQPTFEGWGVEATADGVRQWYAQTHGYLGFEVTELRQRSGHLGGTYWAVFERIAKESTSNTPFSSDG